MTTATLQRELKKIAEKHEQLGRDLERILVLASHEKDLPYGDWELKTGFIKRIEKARHDIRAGKGIRLKSAEEIRSFFRSMRNGNH